MTIDGRVSKIYQFQSREWVEIELDHLQGVVSMENENIDWRNPGKRYVLGNRVHVNVTPQWDAYTPDERMVHFAP